MSLLRLLTTGKSLVDVKANEHRYRLTSQRLLPQFGSAKNPFTSRTESDTGHAEPGSPGDHAEAAGGAPAEQRDMPSLGAEQTPAPQRGAGDRTEPAVAGGPCFAKALSLRTAVVLSRWTARLRGLFPRRRPRKEKTGIPRFTKAAVQGELSLEKIKVVRNDLSDADVEIVPARRSDARARATRGLQTGEQAGLFERPEGQAPARVGSTGKA